MLGGLSAESLQGGSTSLQAAVEKTDRALDSDRTVGLLEHLPLQRLDERLAPFAPAARKDVNLVPVSHTEDLMLAEHHAPYRDNGFERRQFLAQVAHDPES